MQYTLTRYEKIRDQVGNIVEIFISIEIDNGSETYNHGYWLLPSEVSDVLANPSAIDDVIIKASAVGKLAQEAFIATRPLEPIIEDVENIVIDPEDVSECLN